MTVRMLGSHRLVCGDCTDQITGYELFMGEPLADCLLMDPPYGAAFDAGAPERAKRAGRRGGRNPIITVASASWDVFDAQRGEAFLRACLPYVKPTGAVVVWCFDGSLQDVLAAGKACGMRLVTLLTWCKPSATAKFWKHTVLTKACEYAVIFRQKAGIDIYGDLPRNFIVHTMTTTERERAHFHPSPKPELIMRLLVERFSPPGGIVFDPMLGSGTTLIACQQTGRRCFGIEREPKYVEQIEARYAAHVEQHGLNTPMPDLRHGRQTRLDLSCEESE